MFEKAGKECIGVGKVSNTNVRSYIAVDGPGQEGGNPCLS